MQSSLARLLTAAAALVVLVALAWTAWARISPALADGWLGPGMAARVFLPLLLLAGIVFWLWRR